MISETVIDVRYPDCDPMGIVHHAVYPVWYEIARMDFFDKLGFGYSAMHEKGIDPPMVDLRVSFKAPVRYPGRVTVKTRMTAYAPKKLELTYETYDGKALVNSCVTFHIWTGPDGRSLDMKASLPEVYAKLEAAAEPDTKKL